jgi:hypothetical protein
MSTKIITVTVFAADNGCESAYRRRVATIAAHASGHHWLKFLPGLVRRKKKMAWFDTFMVDPLALLMVRLKNPLGIVRAANGCPARPLRNPDHGLHPAPLFKAQQSQHG